jgi:hypothetical protein
MMASWKDKKTPAWTDVCAVTRCYYLYIRCIYLYDARIIVFAFVCVKICYKWD